MNKFWELFQESVILQALITVVLVVGVVYMYATGQEVPGDLSQLLTLVLGFYFGSKVENRKVMGAVGRMLNGDKK